MSNIFQRVKNLFKRKSSPKHRTKKMLKDLKWKPRGRDPIRVIDMSDEYIQNCINLLNRKMDSYTDHDKKTASGWLKVFAFEQGRRRRSTQWLIDELADGEEEADFHLYEEYKL